MPRSINPFSKDSSRNRSRRSISACKEYDARIRYGLYKSLALFGALRAAANRQGASRWVVVIGTYDKGGFPECKSVAFRSVSPYRSPIARRYRELAPPNHRETVSSWRRADAFRIALQPVRLIRQSINPLYLHARRDKERQARELRVIAQFRIARVRGATEEERAAPASPGRGEGGSRIRYRGKSSAGERASRRDALRWRVKRNYRNF